MTTEFEQGYALIIGVGAYQHLSPLAKSPADAKDLADLLVKQCGYPTTQVVSLIDAQATRPNIETQLKWLADQTTKEDTVVIFFSGHGAQFLDGPKTVEYLCPVDATLDTIADTAISGEVFSDALHAIKACKVVVFFDACHSGGVGVIKDAALRMKAGLSQHQYERLAEGEGRVIIASCKADEVSWELAGMNNGLFTHYLLEGLRGQAADVEGEINIVGLFGYTAKKVRAHIDAINKAQSCNIAQTPWINAKTEDFVVAIAQTVDKAEEDVMSGIPAGLLNRLRDTLGRCPAFESQRALRAVFDDSRIALWARGVPETTDLQERVNQTITFLHKKENIRNENGLVLFLRILAESLNPDDKLREELETLADEFEDKPHTSPLPLPVDWSQFAENLLTILRDILALNDVNNRSDLLNELPPGPSGFIERSNAKNADLRRIVDGAKGMGKLISGEHALVIVARNALDFVVGAEPGERLQALLNAAGKGAN